MCELTNDELWLVVRLYAFALSPVILGLYYLIKKNIRLNTSIILCLTFLFVQLDLNYG